MKIRTKLTIVLLVVALVPLAGASISAYLIGRRSITRQVLNQLESVASIQKSRVESILRQDSERLSLLESRTTLQRGLEALAAQPGVDGQALMYQNLLSARSAVESFKDLFVLNPGGTVVASTNPAAVGTSLAGEAFFADGRSGNVTNAFFIGKDGSLMRFLAGPIAPGGNLLGVIVVETSAGDILELTHDYTGLGKTGETVIAQKTAKGDIRFITPNRFGKKTPLSTVLPGNTVNLAMAEALAGRERVLENEVDYRGKSVLAATRFIKSPGWGLVTKIDRSEAFAPVNDLGLALIGVVFGVALLVVVFAMLMARSITGPVSELTGAAAEISAGDLTRRADVRTYDEVGQLAIAFNKMTDDLQEARSGLERKVEERTAELAASNAELEGYAHTVSHDLKGPLTAATVAAQILEDRRGQPGTEAEAEELLDIIEKNLAKAFVLVDDLLALAEAGQVPDMVTDVDVGEVVENVLDEKAGRISEKGVRVEVTGDLGVVRANETHVCQLFSNLIGNSIKHNTSPDPVVCVSYLGKDDNGRNRYTVCDNGPGMPPADMDRLFVPFFKGKTGETGVGLTIVERIVKIYGGHIRAYNEGGACFEFTIGDLDVTRGDNL